MKPLYQHDLLYRSLMILALVTLTDNLENKNLKMFSYFSRTSKEMCILCVLYTLYDLLNVCICNFLFLTCFHYVHISPKQNIWTDIVWDPFYFFCLPVYTQASYSRHHFIKGTQYLTNTDQHIHKWLMSYKTEC